MYERSIISRAEETNWLPCDFQHLRHSIGREEQANFSIRNRSLLAAKPNHC